ncbi:MAG: hypothetical protein H6773_00680 [Pseudomonadales bacterium]|nr:hypothetical protein [Candidatus Woesebacteria bacterium]MCB9800674.1 hypothetical protein [Pseudomonadales bacterium]
MKNLPKHIALLYSEVLREYFPTEQQYISEIEVENRSKLIASYLEKMGIRVTLIPGNKMLSETLKIAQPDVVINLVDSVYGQEYLSASIPGTLEILNIPYTGTGMLGQAINSNKYFTKTLLEQYGITTPKYQLIKNVNETIDPVLDFPLIVKLNEIHGSIEIDDNSVCIDKKSTDARINYLMNTYRQPILLEEFVVGREITVIVFEGLHTKVYAAEKIFDKPQESKYQIVTFDDNWNDEVETITYQKYTLPERVKQTIKTAFQVLKMEDYAKFDIRLDASGRHYIIDCNTNPTLGPKNTAAIGTITQLYGITFEELLTRLISSQLYE